MKTTLPIMVLAGLLSTGLPAAAQQPVLSYTLAVNPDDSSTVQIVMRLRNLPETFHLAMVKHFLTDDRYWRYVEDLQIAPGTLAREQDGLWRVSGAGRDTTIRYKVRLEDKGASRVVRKPFLTPTGGLFGEPALHTTDSSRCFPAAVPNRSSSFAIRVRTAFIVAPAH